MGVAMDGLDLANYYHIPCTCKGCGGVMVYKGVGEYECEQCGDIDYDDYGKVRLYIEQHKGATAAEIEMGVGVSQRSIRKMLREERLEIADGSKVFLRCEICGVNIRSGRYCPACEFKAHRHLEEEQREKLRKSLAGYSNDHQGDEGHKRFVRDR